MDIDWEKGGGLVPAIVQDADSLQVLMLGYMNEEALEKSRKTGLATFFSRSRQTLWTKGETSGNHLALVDIQIDCDNDTLLVTARPKGPTCHLGTPSCFGDQGPTGYGWLAALESVIEGRKTADPGSSYSASLLQGPIKRAAQKVGEEGVETALAAMTDDLEELKNESADLIYHLVVVLAAKGLSLQDVIKTLQSRSS